jgi:hypothetical protein
LDVLTACIPVLSRASISASPLAVPHPRRRRDNEVLRTRWRRLGGVAATSMAATMAGMAAAGVEERDWEEKKMEGIGGAS